MAALSDPGDGEPPPGEDLAIILLDGAGIVRRWSRGAVRLLGRRAEEICGQPVSTLFVDPTQWSRTEPPSDSARGPRGRSALRHRSGQTVEVTVDTARLDGSSEVLLLVTPVSSAAEREDGLSFLRALLAQDHIGVAIHDTELNVVRTNVSSGMLGGRPLGEDGRLREAFFPEDVEKAEALLCGVLATGTPVIAEEQRMRAPDGTDWERSLSVSAFRVEDGRGVPTGVAVMFTDVTEQRRARRRTEMSHAASVRIGGSLDVTRTAQALADVLVPALGDMASVDIADAVVEGKEPMRVLDPCAELGLRRVAVASVGPWPADVITVGCPVPRFPDVPEVRMATMDGITVVHTSRQDLLDIAGDPELIQSTVPEKGHSVVGSPLFARGRLLGFVTLLRAERPEPFEQEDADLVFDIASRAALSVDNARRYTREHRAAVALQQRLLPRTATRTTAAETVGSYVPAGGGADIGGDWFDAIPLPSLRVAFVVGDVTGHGLSAAATMGRLRTAIRTLADLELEPGELLIHLDDLVQQLADEADPEERDTIGATCLYALYDPIDCGCSLASAGHPPPLVIEPGGTALPVQVSPGPPLGIGSMPFDITTVRLKPGSTLALYTDGLVDQGPGGADQGIRELTDALAEACRGNRPLGETSCTVMAGASRPSPRDDMALLLARTRRLLAADIAAWDFPDDPAAVAEARSAVAARLDSWGLDELTFTTELIVSELVTNAIRYARGAVGLRLFHDDATLVCEVSDSSSTQPRLRRAQVQDEGGRGLYLVAQPSKRWGSRYHHRGKTIYLSVLGHRHIVDHPGRRVDEGQHPLTDPPLDRHQISGGLVHELLQVLLVAVRQPRRHGLDRLAAAVQHEPAQVAVALGPLALPRHRREHIRNV
ncbi:hypothetical protein GCM10011578_050210 [Streptomyces fuscichromogenes]|uniref:PAS domain-containing protein n=1 Tax=Streptomyces fuscichromogenes TaxID=1324013 RepID=A0A918CSS2_9ACTN|nr:hypothetical protein GCM10011578_050210 [Streptomyces fuscichromogenes]